MSRGSGLVQSKQNNMNTNESNGPGPQNNEEVKNETANVDPSSQPVAETTTDEAAENVIDVDAVDSVQTTEDVVDAEAAVAETVSEDTDSDGADA